MVRLASLAIIFIVLLANLYGAVKVSVELDSQTLHPGQAISGTLTVIHGNNEAIDLNGVLLGNDPLKVTVRSMEKTNGDTKTTLDFTLPAQQKGIQLLPVISIPVAGKRYTTVSQTYTINGGNGMPAPAQPQYGSAQKGKTWLKLETFIEGKSTLYPGQRTIVGYRYFFNGNIQLVDEKLPLLEADGFKKVGDLNTKDLRQKQYAIRQIAQEIEAEKPGEYQFAESSVSGYVYTSVMGQQTPLDNIQATAPPVTITVKAFPEENKPTSFNGAIGNFTFKMRLLSPSEVSVGDKLTLSIEITGKGDLDDVPMPEICCQPGFSGNFQQSDIPPAGIVKGDSKIYVVDIRPLSDKLTEIPSLEFSFFNPDANAYQSLRSDPIPITVHPSDSPFSQPLPQTSQPAQPTQTTPSTPPPSEQEEQPTGIEISGNVRLTPDDLSDRPFSSWWTLLIIPVIIGAFWLQIHMKKALEAKERTQAQQNSQAWMDKAHAAGDDLAKLCHALDKAFISLLREKGIIPSEDITPYQLPQEGVSGDVRAFLTGIEESRFAGKGDLSPSKILNDAQKLYDDIKRSTMS